MKNFRFSLRKIALAAVAVASIGAFSPQAFAASDAATLRVGTMWEAMPLSMKPRRSRFFNESEILDTLVKLDYDMALVPGLATSWERVSPTVWRFKLRENVKFHDGSDFNAAAAKESLEHVVALLPYAAELLNIKQMKAVDDLTLEVETTEPFAALPNQLTDAITGIYGAASFDADGAFVTPVGTGPWKLAEYRKQDRTIVERFDSYWGGKPALERIEYRYIPDHNSRTLALEAGEVDFVDNLLPADVARLERSEGFDVYKRPIAGLYYGGFNSGEKSPLHDPRVRQALNLMVDRSVLVEAALEGVGEGAWRFFSPHVAWAPKDVTPYAVDLEKAAALLGEAGYEKVGGKWTRDGAPLNLRILSYSSRTEMPAITEVMAALLNEQGIDVNVQMYTWEGMLDLVKRGEYDVSIVFWTPEMTGHPDLHLKSQFHSKAGLNHLFWANEEFDALVDKGRTLDEGEARQKTYAKALQILQDDAPIIPLAHKVYVAASSDKLKGFKVHPSGFFYDFKSVSK